MQQERYLSLISLFLLPVLILFFLLTEAVTAAFASLLNRDADTLESVTSLYLPLIINEGTPGEPVPPATQTPGPSPTPTELPPEPEMPGVSVYTAVDLIGEGDGTTDAFRLVRSGEMSVPLTVTYGLSGTAVSGVDFEPLPSEILLPAFITETVLALTPLDNDLLDGDRTVLLNLTESEAVVLINSNLLFMTAGPEPIQSLST